MATKYTSAAAQSASKPMYQEMEDLRKELSALKEENLKLQRECDTNRALIMEINAECIDWGKLYENRGHLLRELREELEALKNKAN